MNKVKILRRTKLLESIIEKNSLELRRFPISSRAVKMFLEEIKPSLSNKLQESMVDGGTKYMPISGGLYDVFTNAGKYVTTDVCRIVKEAKGCNGQGGKAVFEDGEFPIETHYFRQISAY